MHDIIYRQDAIDTDGLDEEIRCEMCKNPMHTDRGCDGNCKYDEILYEKIIQILDKRITPLPPAQPEQCKDAVSKAKVLETYADLYDVFDDNKGIQHELHKVFDRINNLPSAQPEQPKNGGDIWDRLSEVYNMDTVPDEAKSIIGDVTIEVTEQPEQRWIPVSEGLPKEYGEYICTMENGQVQECGFVPENQRGLVDGWSTCEADGHKFLGYADVLAWMPRPKPWKEGEA